jgi:hypothetical protein
MHPRPIEDANTLRKDAATIGNNFVFILHYPPNPID